MSKKYEKHLIGTAGELAVAKMMCLQNYVPSLTNNNCPVFDLFVFDPDKNKKIIIQVKTTKDKALDNNKIDKRSSFPLSGIFHSRLEEGLENIVCPFVFVHIDVKNKFDYYILSSRDLKEVITLIDKYCREGKKRKNKEFSPKEGVAIPLKYIERYKDKWDNIWNESVY